MYYVTVTLAAIGFFIVAVSTLCLLDYAWSKRETIKRELRILKHYVVGIRPPRRITQTRYTVHEDVEVIIDAMHKALCRSINNFAGGMILVDEFRVNEMPSKKRTGFGAMTREQHRAASAAGGAKSKGRKRNG